MNTTNACCTQPNFLISLNPQPSSTYCSYPQFNSSCRSDLDLTPICCSNLQLNSSSRSISQPNSHHRSDQQITLAIVQIYLTLNTSQTCTTDTVKPSNITQDIVETHNLIGPWITSHCFFKDDSSSIPCMEFRMVTHMPGSNGSNLKFQCMTVHFSVNKVIFH